MTVESFRLRPGADQTWQKGVRTLTHRAVLTRESTSNAGLLSEELPVLYKPLLAGPFQATVAGDALV